MASGAGLIAATLSSSALDNLEILDGNYPRAGYFRVAENTIRDEYDGVEESYEEWRDLFSDLSGIMGKTEYEELVKNNPYEQILDWFQRYKQDFPNKYVVVHFNGRGRVPNYRLGEYFAGHWLHFEGCDVLSDLPAESDSSWEEEVWVQVEDTSCFKLDNGRQNNRPDDVTLVRRNPDGSLDWSYAEEVRLQDIDTEGGRILIKRSMFNTTSLSFSSTNTYAAAHIMGGPWGDTFNMVWYGNFSTECPRDAQGRTYADVLCDELAGNFEPGGRWALFDGVEFDVMQGEPGTGYHPSHRAEGHLADVDGDGIQDDGIVDGVQSYGLGVYEFLHDLRDAVGTNRIIAADGRAANAQKVGGGVLNGVEMEGMPAQEPTGFVDWSTPLNMLDFWKPETQTPRFNYGAVRYNKARELSEEELFRYYRLSLAAASFTDGFIMAMSSTTNRLTPALDLTIGREGSAIGWLGAPTGERVHLASQSADELQERGNPVSPDIFLSDNPDMPWLKPNPSNFPAAMQINASGNLEVAPAGTEESFQFKIKNVPYSNEEVFIEMRIRSKGAIPGYPADYNRYITAQVDGITTKAKTLSAYFNSEWQVFRFYFANTVDLVEDTDVVFNPSGEDRLDIEFTVWGPSTPVEISRVTVHDAPEVVYRSFERGAIVANLSESSVDFDLSEASPYLSGIVSVPSKDALFLENQPVWTAGDGKWEDPSNWAGGSLPVDMAAVITNGGVVRVDSTSGNLATGPDSGTAVVLRNNSELSIEGGGLSVRTGLFASEGALLSINGGMLQTTNTLSFNNSVLRVQGGHVVAGDALTDSFILRDGSSFTYSGGELDVSGHWNREMTGLTDSGFNHQGLIGGGDFNAVQVGNSFTPAQMQFKVSLADEAVFRPGDAFVLLEFRSGSWAGSGDDHYFRNADGALIENFNSSAFGDPGQSNSMVYIQGYPFYLNYNANLSLPEFSAGYNVINTGNYLATSAQRQVVLIAAARSYGAWSDDHHLTEGPLGDDDGDGQSNLYEYGLGGNPTNAGILSVDPVSRFVSEEDENWFEYIHLRRIDAGLDYRLELATNLLSGAWTNIGYEVSGSSGDRGDGFESVTNRISTESFDLRFIQLQVREL